MFLKMRKLEALRREMEQLFSSPSMSYISSLNASFPLVNLYEDQDNLVVVAEVPGVDPESVQTVYKEGVLTLRKERPVGEFEKNIRVPFPVVVDQISATLQDGMLVAKLPKAEEAKPKQIKIQV
mgnify:CR=1 FL=1